MGIIRKILASFLILNKKMPLARKFMLSVGLMSLALLATDAYFNIRQSRELIHETTRDWTLLLAEDVRTSLNMLMKEDRMDLRFSLFDSMKQELEGLKEVRIIRAPHVSEMLRREREEIAIPREEKAIRRFSAQILELQQLQKTAADRDEKIQLREEIEELRQGIASSLNKINKMRNTKDVTRKDEAILDDLDQKVINSGKPIYQFNADEGRVVIPYTTRKDCMRASGCHHLAKEGEVLGAISMSFSLEHINQHILEDSIAAAAYGVLKLVIVLLVLLFFIVLIVENPLQKLKEGAQAVADGNLRHTIDIKTGDELQDLAENFNSMGEKLYERTKLLSDAKEYVENIIGSMIDMLIVLTPSETIAQVNSSTCKLLGYPEEKLVGQPISLIMNENNLMQDFGSFIRTEKTFITSDGRHIPVMFSASAMRDENRYMLGIVCVAQDITDRKRAEMEIIRARQEAEQTSRLKSEFLANMSHEIRTPLSAVIGMTSLTLDSDLTDAQRHYLETSQKCAHSLLEVINDILDFSKIESGKLSLHPEDFDLRRIVEGIADTLAANAHAKGLELVCMVQDNIPSPLIGDPGRVRQVLLNLSGNAVKFTAQGEVVIKAELKEETDMAVTVLFSVTDTGIGIEKTKLNSIFQPFVQADGSTTRMYGGTGLGLSISRELVGLMNGDIGVESEPGKGSRFWFTTVFEKIHGAAYFSGKPVHDFSGIRALIVEDNQSGRAALVSMLEGFGCRTLAAGNGVDAIDLLRESISSEDPVNLILLDSQMPEMNGDQVLAVLKHSPESNKIPKVLLTTLGQQEGTPLLEESGCIAYLIKPVKHSQLQDLLTRISVKEEKIVGTPLTPSTGRRRIPQEKVLKTEVLLVEDNPLNQKIMATILRNRGFSVDTTSNGFLAVEAMGKKRYNLIFINLRMSVMDGFETARRIREKEGNNLPHTIIAIAPVSAAVERKRCIEAGMNDCISTPLDPTELFETIQKWIEDGGLAPAGDGEYIAPRVNRENGLDADHQPVTIERAMARFGHDTIFFREMLSEFLNYLPEKMELLAEAIHFGSGLRLEKHAFDIMSIAANLNADVVSNLAHRIAQRGREKDVIGAASLLDELKDEIEKLEKFLAGWT